MLPKRSTYMKYFEESKYMTLLVIVDNLINESNEMGNRISIMLGKELENNQFYEK